MINSFWHYIHVVPCKLIVVDLIVIIRDRVMVKGRHENFHLILSLLNLFLVIELRGRTYNGLYLSRLALNVCIFFVSLASL